VGRFSPRILQIETHEHAVRELRRVAVDPGGIAEMAPKMGTRCILVQQLGCHHANILKQEMLSCGGDAAVARGTVSCSVDATDCILIGTKKQLQRLCHKLTGQPFALSELSAELISLLSTIDTPPTVWRVARHELSLQRPLIMGILNMTPDSFSDGGRFCDPVRAIEHARIMEDEGADIIDIGGESSRPGSQPVSEEEELARIMPVLEHLSGNAGCAISVDTWKSGVARRVLAAGADIINDISGLTFDSEMAAVVATSRAGVVVMHTRGVPVSMQQNTAYIDLMSEVCSGLRSSVAQAVQCGISADRIAVDPGIGFGKDCSGNLELLRRLPELKSLGFPILCGSSRKSFIGKVLGRDNADDRLFGTAATVALAVANGAGILRVHDVRAMRDVVDMASAVVQC